MSKMFLPKTIKISFFFSELLSVMSRMVFGVFLFISTLISRVLIFPGSAEACVV